MGTHVKKTAVKKPTKKNKKKSGWARFCRVIKILDSRWFAAALAIVGGIAAYGKERK